MEEMKSFVTQGIAEKVQGTATFDVPVEEVKTYAEEHEAYTLSFSSNTTIQDMAFNYKRLEDYILWQQQMLRCYTDSFLIDECIAKQKIEVICTDHKFKVKEDKKQKGRLKATFIIKSESGELLDTQVIDLQKLPAENVHHIIDAHMYLLEMGLQGYLCEEEVLEKFGRVLNKPNLVEATKALVQEIKSIRSKEDVESN